MPMIVTEQSPGDLLIMINWTKINRTVAFSAVLIFIFSACSQVPTYPESTSDTEIAESTLTEVTQPPDSPLPDSPVFSRVESIRVKGNEGVAENLYSNATGIHGGHESRIARTENGTFAVYIINEHPDETYDFTWDEFAVVKLNEGTDEIIFRDKYPHSFGSCAPNILRGSDGKLYVTVIADDKTKYYSANFAREGAWLRIYVIDPVTYDVKTYSHNPDFDVIWVHGYGYSQPILDEKAGKLYALFTGGDIPGYLAWFNFDLKKMEWESGCYTVQTHSRVAYFNAYPDGKGGFYFISERAVLASELGKYLGVTFEPSTGYIWDALYLGRVRDATVAQVELTPIREYPFVKGTTMTHPAAVHYGRGCSYLDKSGVLHLIYSFIYKEDHKVFYVRYDKDLNVIEERELEIEHPKYTFAMAEGICGDLYIIGSDNAEGIAKKNYAELDIWRSSDGGDSYLHIHHQRRIYEKSGKTVEWFYKLNASSTRNGSITDGTVDLLFFNSDNLYFHFKITLP